MLANSNEEPQQPAQQTQINNKSLTESEDDKSSNDNSFTASASYKGPYPIDQINNVRDYLVKEFINAPCRSKAELFLKLKLGIINDEIIDYFKYDKPHNPHLPDAFPEDDDDEADENPICIDEDYNSADEKEKASKEDGLEEPDNKTNASQEEVMKLSQTLKLEHGCESKFCPRDISFKDKYDPFDHINSVYICDVCFKMTGLKPSMEEHLKGENHFSASEYIVEGKKDEIYDPTISPMQSMSNSSIGTSSSETNLSLSNRKVAFLKKRSSLRNFNVNDSFIVFCPKPECSAFMSTNVLACALHYKYVHSVDKDVEIYSIGRFERLQEVEIEKKHSCPQCKLYHSKLLSLCEHLKNTDHFPRARKDEINVFVCPFDDCHFKSTIFFAFKTHLLSHKFFVSVGGEKITCKIRVYSAPKCFYHVPRFGEKSGLHEHIECERQCERKAIDDLVELHKNHSQFFEVNKQLKERKEQISSALMRTS